MEEEILVKVSNLKKYFEVKQKSLKDKKAVLKAVDDVNFEVYKNETLGIVGESGCGKSTLGKSLLRLFEIDSGQVIFNGDDIFSASKKDLILHRKKMQMIFQDPYSSLNPRKTIEKIISQPLRIHKQGTREEISKKVDSLLEDVGLGKRYKQRYPHQFSGGQRQRIGIARALALNPDLIICDESVSALDVSIQAQVLNLLKDLQKKYNLTYIFIAHDLSVVEFISDRIIVMYLGKIVELANKLKLINHHIHPYTKALFKASPSINPRNRTSTQMILGDVPSPINPPSGCYFHPRCPNKLKKCEEIYPDLVDIGNKHFVACHNLH